jgi:hypothetical protein
MAGKKKKKKPSNQSRYSRNAVRKRVGNPDKTVSSLDRSAGLLVPNCPKALGGALLPVDSVGSSQGLWVFRMGERQRLRLSPRL